MTEDELYELTHGIIRAAIAVHEELGPGLLERVYVDCLKIALEEEGYHVDMEIPLSVIFRGRKIAEDGYRLDLLVNDIVILEIKSVLEINSVHVKQLNTYLRLANKPCGLLINFNVSRLAHGIKRIRNGELNI